MHKPLIKPDEVPVATVTIARAVGDPLRANVLRVLSQDSYGVLELGEIFEMAQPAISHHLKTLHNAGLVSRRKEGTHVFYQRVSAGTRPLLAAIFDELDNTPLLKHLQQRIDDVHHRRMARSRAFFASHATALAQQRELICAPEVYHSAVLEISLKQSPLARQRALEVGPGDGALMVDLAETFADVTGIDSAADLVAATREQLADSPRCRLLEGDFLTMPVERRYNMIIAAMVVHHLASPRKFFSQARRHLHPEGVLVIVELNTHTQEWVKDLCGDVWLGFAPEQLADWAAQSHFKMVHQQFLAQRNGFPVHVHAFQPHT